MRTIYKYPLQVFEEQEIALPSGAWILCVQVQNGVPCIWAYVDPNVSMSRHKIRTYGTGQAVDDQPGQYLGTYQLADGNLVFHVFKLP